MRAEELMIGDWVIDEYTNRPMRIEAVNKMMGSGLFPIPLTAEILEKNEFELQEQDFTDKLYRLKYGHLYLEPYSSNIKDGYSVGCSITNYDHFNVHTRWLPSFCKVYYVHELQHALCLCGLNDLVNNFKI